MGLIVAFFGPMLLSTPVHKLLGPPGQILTRVLELLFLWGLAGVILAIVVWWKKLPVSSIGLQPRWSSAFWGVGLALIFNRAVAPFLYWVIHQMGSSGFEIGLGRMVDLPVWFLFFVALTAGVTEETLFRGYGIERLAAITGSYWWAGLISTVAAALLHLPMWGWGAVVTFFISGGILTIFYIYKRDLIACMIVHAITDAVGFITAHPASLPH